MKKKRKKLKTGPRPLGLGPLFSVRLTAAQDKRVRALAGQGGGLGAVIREALALVWEC